jgi:predicted permease
VSGRKAGAAARVYRALLCMYSRRFRRLYADDMARVFRRRLARARARAGLPGALRCWAATLKDVAANAPAERLSARRRHFVADRGKQDPAAAPQAKGDLMISRLLSDVRFALRTMARQPVTALAILLTLAIGSGATIAIFSVVDAALVHPLPYPGADRLAAVVQATDELGTMSFAPPFLRDLRERSRSFEALAGFSASGWIMTMTGAGEPRVVSAAYVSDGLLDLLGVRPAAGRDFTAAEHTPGGADAVLMSASLWAATFGAGTEPRGQVVQLGGVPYRVVGVLPADFDLPITDSVVSSNRESADVLLPFAGHWSADVRIVPIMNIVGRLADGATLAAAGSEIEALRPALAAEFPEAELAPRFAVLGLADLVTQQSRATVWMLFGAAGLLLLIACVNVANLMLARATRRRREIAVRAALGASRGRLAEQVLTEALVFAALGCGAGFLLAGWLLSTVPALGLRTLAPSARVAIDLRVAGFATLLALACAAAFGLLPLLYSWRVRPFRRMGSGARSGAPAHGTRRALVVAEVALAVVLLVGAGLLSSSFWRLSHVDPGFRATGLVSVPLAIADAGYDSAGARGSFMIDVVERLRGLPGITDVAAVNRLPLGGSNVLVGMEAEGQAPPEGAGDTVDRRVVTPGYFDVMGIPVLGGRDFTVADDAQSAFRAAIVNRSAAELFWPGAEAVGRRVRLALRGGPGPWMTIVGVAADIRHHGLDQPPRPEIYVPYQQASVETMVALLRTADAGEPPGSLLAAIKDTVWALDPDLPMDHVAAVEEVVADSVAEPRLRTAILATFAAVALALAAIGIGGVVSFSIIQRRRDIAVRMALGARGDQILRQTVREGFVLGLVGAALGLLAAAGLTRLLAGLLFEVGTHDPLTFAGVTLLLLAVVGAASWLPARHATRVDPIIALRAD